MKQSEVARIYVMAAAERNDPWRPGAGVLFKYFRERCWKS